MMPARRAPLLIRLPPQWILAFLCAAYFVVIANITLVIPVLPYMTRELGLDAGERQWLLAAFPAVAFAANLLLGPWIDRVGRKPFLMLGAIGTCVTFLTTAWASSSYMVIAARALTGLFVPMMGATIFAAIADYFPEEQRAQYSGYVAATAPVAQLLSIPLTLFAGQSLSWKTPFFVFAVLCGLLFVLSATIPARERSKEYASGSARRGLRAAISDWRNVALLIAYFAFSAASFCFLAMYPMWLIEPSVHSRDSSDSVTVFCCGGVAGFAGAVLAPRLSKAMRSPMALCAAMALGAAIAMAAIPPFPASIVPQLVAYSAFSFCRAAMLPLVMSSGMSLAGSEQRSTLNGMLNAIFQSAAAIGSLAGASLYVVSPSYWGVCGFAAGIFLLSALAFSTAGRPPRVARSHIA